MQKIFFVIFLVGIVVVGLFYFGNQKPRQIQSETPVETQEVIQTDFTARFEVYTNGTKRVFTAAMYHNKSQDAFIQNPDPSVIYIKKLGVTWDEFFKTLPFSLDKNCLVTGTKQTFCSRQSQRLHFLLNVVEVPDALDLEIKPNDYLEVRFE